MQSFMLTEVRDCDLLIVVTSSTFLKRKHMLKEKSSWPRSSKSATHHICRQKYCVHLYGLHVYCALVDLDSSDPPGVRPTLCLVYFSIFAGVRVVCVCLLVLAYAFQDPMWECPRAGRFLASLILHATCARVVGGCVLVYARTHTQTT